MHSSLFRATVARMATASDLTPPLHSLQNGPASATSRAQTDRPNTIADQLISGDVYRKWRGTLYFYGSGRVENQYDIVESKLGIVGLGSPDNETNS